MASDTSLTASAHSGEPGVSVLGLDLGVFPRPTHTVFKTCLKFPCLQCATKGLYVTVSVVLYCVQCSQALIADDFEEKTTLQLNNSDCLGTKKQVSSDAIFWLLFF